MYNLIHIYFKNLTKLAHKFYKIFHKNVGNLFKKILRYSTSKSGENWKRYRNIQRSYMGIQYSVQGVAPQKQIEILKNILLEDFVVDYWGIDLKIF